MPSIHLTKAANGQSFDLHAGDEITIELDESMSGYRWAVDHLDAGILTLQSDEYVLGGGVGAGRHKLTFKAQQPGSTSIGLKLWRDWQGDASIIERFQARINVH